MADSVNVLPIFYGYNRYAVRMMCVSDGTGEVKVVKVDLSALSTTLAPERPTITYTAIEEIKWDVQGFSAVELFWDHNTDDPIDVMSGVGVMSYHDVGYLMDPRSAGGTGNILLSSYGAVNNATYDITAIIQLRP